MTALFGARSPWLWLTAAFSALAITLRWPLSSDFSLKLVEIYRVNYFVLILCIPALLSKFEIDRNKFIDLFIAFYTCVAITVILDAFCSIYFGHSIFYKNMMYITLRFYGPFYDPNFMGVIYGIFFLTEFFYKRRLTLLSLASVCLLLSGSWSSLIITLIAMLWTYVHVPTQIVVKPLLAILSMILVLFHYGFVKSEMKEAVIHGFAHATGMGLSEAAAKYLSLTNRFDAQAEALNLIMANPLGYGARSISTLLPLDPHNSFVGITLEHGLLGLLITVFGQRALNPDRDKMADSLIGFFSLSALLLNVHYMPVFIFVVIVAFRRGKYALNIDR